MIHLETLMIWSLTAMTVREAGAHVFTRERQNFPPSGEMASPFGLAPHGSGSAPLRGTVGSTRSASQKTKPSSATLCETFGFTQLRSAKDKSIAHYVRSHKGVCNECMLACARTKDKNHKRQSLAQRRALWCYAPMYCPLRGQCHGANAAQGTQTTSALHKGVFYDRACSLRSHKSVRSASSALALAQKRVLWKYVLIMQSVCMALTSAITGRVYDIDERHTKACFMILKNYL